MSYSDYEFGDFRKIYEGGPSAGLVGFAQGFAQGFVPAYTQAVKDRRAQEDELFRLAVKDIQEQEKAKAKSGKKESTWARQAAAQARNFPNLPGVERHIYDSLVSGMTMNAIVSDLQTAIKENRVRATNSEGTYNPLEDNTPEAPSVETQTDEALESSAVETPAAETQISENQNMDSGDFLTARISTRNTDSSFEGEGVEIADASNNWFANIGETLARNRNATIAKNVQSRVDAWKAATGRDATTPSGLTTTSKAPVTSVSNEIKSGASSDVAVGTVLSIIPKVDDPESAIELKPINETSTVPDLIIARELANSDPDNPESGQVVQMADKLIQELTEMPSIGELPIADLELLVSTPKDQLGPMYSGLSAVAFRNLRATARELIETKEREGLPAINFTTSAAGLALQADIAARFPNAPDSYVSEVNDLTEAWKDAEEIAKAAEEEKAKTERRQALTDSISGQDFTLEDYDNLNARMVIELSTAEYKTWKAGKGKLLLEIATQGSDRKPGDTTLSSDEVAMRFRNATQIMNNPTQHSADDVKAAENYINNIYPSEKAALDAVRPKTPTPPQRVQVTWNDGSGEQSAYGVINDDGTATLNRRTEGNVTTIPANQIVTFLDADQLKRADAQAARLPTTTKDLPVQFAAAADFARQAKILDDIVVKNEQVLLAAGPTAKIFEDSKSNLFSLINYALQISGADVPKVDEETANPSAIAAALAEAIDNDDTISTELKSAYKQFASQSVLLIFKAGTALGSSGQAFSNKDYIVLQDSLMGATSYKDFTAILRNFARGLIKKQDELAAGLETTTSTQQILNTEGVERGTEFDGATGYFKTNGLTELLDWANGAQSLEEISSSSSTSTENKVGKLTAEQRAKAEADIARYKAGEEIIWTEELNLMYPNMNNVGDTLRNTDPNAYKPVK